MEILRIYRERLFNVTVWGKNGKATHTVKEMIPTKNLISDPEENQTDLMLKKLIPTDIQIENAEKDLHLLSRLIEWGVISE